MPLAVSETEAHCRFCKHYIHPEITWRGDSSLRCLNWPGHTTTVLQTVVFECLMNVFHTNVNELRVRHGVGSLCAKFPLQLCQCILILIFSNSLCYCSLGPSPHRGHYQAHKQMHTHAQLWRPASLLMLHFYSNPGFQTDLPAELRSDLQHSLSLVINHSADVQVLWCCGRGHNVD